MPFECTLHCTPGLAPTFWKHESPIASVSYPALATILHTYALHYHDLSPTLEYRALKVWIVASQKYQKRRTQTMHTLYPFDQISQLREYGGKTGGVKEGLVGEQGRVVVTVNILSVDQIQRQIQRQTHTDTKTNTNREARRRGWLLGGESGHGWCSLRGGCWTWSQCAPPPVDQQIPIALLLPIQSRPLV